jgi:hypothetical protein
LRKNAELNIGMAGEEAFRFNLQPGESLSSGFLKLFMSTKPVDVKQIELKPPFDPRFKWVGHLGKILERTEALSVSQTKSENMGGLEVQEAKSKWHALTVKLTLHADKDKDAL